MAIDVGDAVLTFIGDTTQLDLAYDKVNAGTEAATKPATVAVTELGDAFDKSGIEASIATEQYTAAGRAALRAGEEGAAAGEKMAFSMHEAKGELALLGEETGITVPRHVRAFIAELPGVGKALNAAFSATAVLIIIQLLAEATNKLTEFISEHILYTEAMKEEYKIQVELNHQIEEQVNRMEGLKEIYKTLGVEGAAKTQISIEELTDKLKEQNDQMQFNKDTIFLYNNYLKGTAEEAQKAAFANDLLRVAEAANEQQMLNLIKLHAQQQLDEGIKRQTTMLEAEKVMGDAALALQAAQERTRLLQSKATYSELLTIQQKFHDDEFKLEIDTMEKRLAVLKRDPTKNAEAIITLNGQLEAAQRTHEANLLNDYGDYLERLKAATKSIEPTIVETFELIENEAGEKLDMVTQAFANLGITGVVPLTLQLHNMQKAQEDLRKSGLATAADLLAADLAILQVKIAIAHLDGTYTKQMQKDLDAMVAKYDKLTGAVTKLNKQETLWSEFWNKDSKKIASGMRALQDVGENAFMGLTQGIAQSVAAAALGADDFDVAMQRMLASVLANIAGQATFQALRELALGFAALAPTSPDFGFAGAHFAAAGQWAVLAGISAGAAAMINPSAATTPSEHIGKSVTDTPAEAAAPQPVQITNVQKFATGGLITRPTLAMMAESSSSSREAAIPLDDPRAIQPIVEALGGGGGTVIHVHVQGLISPDNLGKVMNKINQKVKNGQGHLLASNALRVTKRSV